MPEATVLYSVTGVVLVGLVAWVSMVLKQAKEPWSRPAPPEEPADEHETPEATKADADETPKLDADDTARATPVALSEGRTKAADEKPADEKPADEKPADDEDKPAEEEKKAEA